tara:strand:+ start:334 stop:1125 length:792 start_codon:yes stop_codon:yes gene_type:complete
MWRGFDIDIKIKENEVFERLKKVGQSIYNTDLQQVQFSLNTFINGDNSLDGTAIRNYWFPQVDTDVFISHSHKDVDTALVLCGWLWETFEIRAFIDSSIWGYSNDLQRAIDNKHCFIPTRNVYSYELRNHSTSHVHMILSTALNMMIDKSECLFFLNTPNSIRAYDKTDKTESPWIYSEIATSQIIQKTEPVRRVTESFSNFEGESQIKKGVTITHNVDLNHLTKLDFDKIIKWGNSKREKEHPLDTLYRLYPPKKKSNQLLK